jgi:Ohr subfamily peroxiredoxin
MGGREGSAKSDDGKLNLILTPPGSIGNGTNPEQLFAAGWSACFIGAIRLNAVQMRVSLPEELSVDTEVDLASGPDGFNLQARLTINLPGVSVEHATAIVKAAHETCPYSKATHGNINVTLSITV